MDKDKPQCWLKVSALKAQTEGFIITAEDQSLPRRWYQYKILKTDVDPKCRLCGHFDGNIGHLVSVCPGLVKTVYIHRHNKADAQIHWEICKAFSIEVKE